MYNSIIIKHRHSQTKQTDYKPKDLAAIMFVTCPLYLYLFSSPRSFIVI